MSLVAGALGTLTGTVAQTASSLLSQAAQNGGGTWGLLTLPPLVKFLAGESALVQSILNALTTVNANPYTSAPSGAATRSYFFNVAPCNISPDGVSVNDNICINGQFPGPLIEANYGDMISVTVNNNIPSNRGQGTAMHWHGFLQGNTSWEDGVPSVSQCPIAPGKSFTYQFQASLYGTSWYHSHYSAQYTGGVFGPIVVHGPTSLSYDIDVGPVMLMDWYHAPWQNLVSQLMTPIANGGGQPLVNNVLINGKGSYDCSKTALTCVSNAPVSKFAFKSGKTHLLRLINTGAQAQQKFSIDGHTMTVIAQDFVAVKPYTANIVALGVGQRADVLVTANGDPTKSYWMRSSILGCSENDGVSTVGLASIYYEKANQALLPTSTDTNGNNDTSGQSCLNPPLASTVPEYPIPASTDIQQTLTLAVTTVINSTGYRLYTVNGSSFRGDYNSPTLQAALNGQQTFPTQLNAYTFGDAKFARVVVYNYDPAGHPVHLHGHNLQWLNWGFGQWDGSIINPSNPSRRDTVLLPPAQSNAPSYVVVQWSQDNPGVWAMHCHIAWHLSQGFFWQIIASPKKLQRYAATLTTNIAATCLDWNLYAALRGGKVSEPDSGI